MNGEPLFVKGVNLAPTRQALAEATPAEVRRDVELAREAGLDLIRVNGHIARPELYDAADELGMLVWQDFPLQWGYARTIRKEAVRQAREAVDLLGPPPEHRGVVRAQRAAARRREPQEGVRPVHRAPRAEAAAAHVEQDASSTGG